MIRRRPGWALTAPLRDLLVDRKWLIVALMVSSVVSAATETAILGALAEGAAALVNGASRAHFVFGPLHVNERLGVLFLVAFVAALVRLALQGIVSVVPARIAADVLARLRSAVFAAFTRASWSEQSRDREGFLQELLTTQSAQAAIGAFQLTVMIVALTNFLVLVASALALNVVAALVVLIAAAGLFVVMRPLSTLGASRARAVSQRSLAYAGSVNEAVRLAEETHVFDAGEAQRSRIDRLIDHMQAPYFHVQVLANLASNLYQSLIYVLVVGALAALFFAHAGHVASLGAVVLLLIRAGSYGQQMQGAYQVTRQAIPYLERVDEARRRYERSIPIDAGRSLERIDTLAFEHVSFGYDPDRLVLSEVSFSVSRGETIGIVGPTGAGKSTLVQIVLGLRLPTSGAFLVNAVPNTDFSREHWHRAVAYLSQEPRLLHASVSENIRFFRGDLDDEAIQRAARLAGIESEILGWPKGYDTIVGPRADGISGGQQQRICLARALAARPEVLVLDEPTSALDPHAELLIQASLTALKQELTLFVVAHRMSTLDICDRVMVIVDGRLQGFGVPSALFGESDYYRRASSIAVGVSDLPAAG